MASYLIALYEISGKNKRKKEIIIRLDIILNKDRNLLKNEPLISIINPNRMNIG